MVIFDKVYKLCVLSNRLSFPCLGSPISKMEKVKTKHLLGSRNCSSVGNMAVSKNSHSVHRTYIPVESQTTNKINHTLHKHTRNIYPPKPRINHIYIWYNTSFLSCWNRWDGNKTLNGIGFIQHQILWISYFYHWSRILWSLVGMVIIFHTPKLSYLN